MAAGRDSVVLVTASSRGLGGALVEEVQRRGIANVCPTAVAAPLEVTSPASMSRLAQMATDVDIVIDNVGIQLPTPLGTGDFDDIVQTFAVDVYGPLRVTRALAPILGSRAVGAIVNVLLVLSWLSGSGAYSASTGSSPRTTPTAANTPKALPPTPSTAKCSDTGPIRPSSSSATKMSPLAPPAVRTAQ